MLRTRLHNLGSTFRCDPINPQRTRVLIKMCCVACGWEDAVVSQLCLGCHEKQKYWPAFITMMEELGSDATSLVMDRLFGEIDAIAAEEERIHGLLLQCDECECYNGRPERCDACEYILRNL